MSESLKFRGIYPILYAFFDRQGKFRAIAGGGRYDQLVNLVSGGKNDLPAAGFAMGDVVLTELLKDRKLLPEFNQFIDAYVLIEDEALRNDSLRLVQQIRDLGLNAEYSMAAQKSDKQFKKAMELSLIHI